MLKCLMYRPGLSLRLLTRQHDIIRGYDWSRRWQSGASEETSSFSSKQRSPEHQKPLKTFFDCRQTGRGIWKWAHYFDIYHRHFSKFIGADVHVLEIGIYSGGSLEMWRDYFGPKCRVYGVDIEEACKCYSNECTEIFIGDQKDRSFWKTFKERVPTIDILIDDGGHEPEQQIVTLEEMFLHLRPGGIYLCEDVHGEYNGFSAFMQGLISSLNVLTDSDSEHGISPTKFQAWVHSIHFYPYVVVIEKADNPMRQLIAPKHGTKWQPFFD